MLYLLRLRSGAGLLKKTGLLKFCLFLFVFGFFMSFQVKAQPGSVVSYTAPTATHGLISPFTVPITFNDNAFGLVSFQFNILYDPTKIDPSGSNFGCSTAGTPAGAVGTNVLCNVVPGDEGRLRLSSLGFGTFTSGPGPAVLVNLTFVADATAIGGDMSPLTFESDFFFNNFGPIATQNPTNGQISFFGPTAANAVVSGRVLTSDGRGIRSTVLTITNQEGYQTTTLSNPFGYYRFDVPAGGTYTISAFSKSYSFAQSVRVVTVFDAVENVDFVTGK